MTTLKTSPFVVLLLALAACSGASSHPAPAAAMSLSYTNPDSGDWRLVRASSSTATRLVLELWGPAGSGTRGAGLNVSAPDTVRFGRFDSSGTAVEDTGVYELGDMSSGLPAGAYEPRFLAAGVLPGNVLTAGVFQKDRAATAKDSGAALLRIALELPAGSTVSSGTVLPVTVVKAKVIPADIGQLGNESDLLAKSYLQPITVTVGTVTAL